MASRYHFAEEIPHSMLTEEDLVDDSTGITLIIGLATPLSLKNRFVRRLSKLLAAELHIKEGHDGKTMDIFLSRDGNSAQPRLELDEELRKFVRSMEETLASIASHPKGMYADFSKRSLLTHSGPRHDSAFEDLWDAILNYAYGNIDHVIHSLQRTFDDNHDVFADFITKMFGVDELDHDGSELDRELGDRVILLHQAVCGYNGSMRELNLLIHRASEMTRVLLHLEDRFKYLLGKVRFANELYRLICTLGFPEQVCSTLVRAANTSESFRNVTFHLRPLSSSKQVSFAVLPTTPTRPAKKTVSPPRPSPSPPKQEKSKRIQPARVMVKAQPQRKPQPQPTLATLGPVLTPAQSLATLQEKSKSRQRYEAAGEAEPKPQPQPQPQPQSSSVSLGPVLDTVQPYLPEEDRGLALVGLSPAAKQDAVQLVGTILRGRLLPVGTNAWHAFGFVTCKDKAEEQQLAGLYSALLKEAQNPQTIFRELLHAVETNKLVDLFDTKEYGHFRKLFPRLADFLRTAPVERSTVWRLKQFIHDEHTDEPPPTLQRDYGFKFCKQRDDVLRLKTIYDRVLKKMGPRSLHSACTHGRLFETAAREGLFIDIKDKRLMQNDYPSPFVGFDNEGGLEAYRGRFFKRHLKL
jgi:hypothetical protein